MMRKKLPLLIRISAVGICFLLYLCMLIGRSSRWWAFVFAAYLAFLGIWLMISSKRPAGECEYKAPLRFRLSSLLRKVQSRKDQYQG